MSNNHVSGGNFQIVSKAIGTTINNNIAIGPFGISIFSNSYCKVFNNTAVSESGAAFTVGDQDGNFSRHNSIWNNIFVASGTAYAWADDSASADFGNISDYNCIFSTSAVYYQLDGDRADIAAARTQWAVQSTIHKDNEQNSLEVDPQLDTSYRPRNPAVINGGKPDANGNSTSMGAAGAILRGRLRQRFK